MGAARLQKFVRKLDGKYTRFDSAGTVALTEINGFTSIVREGWKKAAADPELQLTYYFPLRDKLVVLHAYIYGDADEAVVLKSICTSFIPDTSPAQALNTVIGDGVSLSFPRTWSVVMNGFTGKKDTVWAVLEKRAGEEGERLAKVSVLGPIASTATMFTSSLKQHLGDVEQAKLLVFHALGYRASLKNIQVLREETVTTAPGLQARLRAVSGEANGEYVELTLQDIPKSDKLLTVVTGAPMPFTDEVRQELATIYASLKIEGDEPKITEHLDMSFFDLLRYLKANRPVTGQTVMGLGLTAPHKETFSNGSNYKANGILLSDGTVISELELREHQGGALFFLHFGEHGITREQLEAELGAFRLFDAPRGKSIHERIGYVNDSTEHFVVMLGVDQTTHELRTLSIRRGLDGR